MALKMLITVVFLVWSVSSDIEQDRTECANQLIGLSTCLPYVGGDAKVPTKDCCTGIKQVLDKSGKCMCVLVRDRNDPKIGFKINATRALSIPSFCHQPTPNASLCVSLLHLNPNSPEAKEFESLGKLMKNATTASASPSKGTLAPTATPDKSDGGKRLKWLGVDMIKTGLLLSSAVYIIKLL